MYKRIICLLLSLFMFVLTGFAQKKAIVIGETADLRVRPDGNGRSISTFEKGDELEIDATRRKKGFFFAFSGNKKGWVRGSRIDIKMLEPNANTVWLYIGRTQRVNNFSVAFHLNITQLVRNGNRIKFWTKAVPDNKKSYLNQFLKNKEKVSADDFRYNMDLWNGDCSTKNIRSTRSLLVWRKGEVSRFESSDKKSRAAAGSAGKTILGEACKIGKKL